MYLDMGNMMSYNKGHGCEQPYVTCTLIPSPLECELYIYLLNTERSSSGVRINDLARKLALKVLHFINIGLSRQGREVPRSDWTEKYWK